MQGMIDDGGSGVGMHKTKAWTNTFFWGGGIIDYFGIFVCNLLVNLSIHQVHSEFILYYIISYHI